MLYYHGTTEFSCQGPGAVTLGKFDGVHRGHRKLLRKIREKEGMQSIVFSLGIRSGQTIYTAKEQKLIAQEAGVDCLIQCPFVPEISRMDPETFISKILKDRLHAKYLAVGPDFRFGRDRSGGIDLLRGAQDRYGYELEVVEKETWEGRDISSTFVREELAAGNMELAGELLGEPYFIAGSVRRGQGEGHRSFVPTINLAVPEDKLLPPFGVYMSRTWIGGAWYPGVTDVGNKPTVGSFPRGIETYLFGAEEEMYGESARTQLLYFRRPERRFSCEEELRGNIMADVAFGKEYFGG